MSPELLSAIGAFLSGAASFVVGAWALRSTRLRVERECERRIRELRAEFERGARFERGQR